MRRSGEAGPHAGWKRLIAYRQGTLPAAERDALQEHLSLCPRCTRRLMELRDFETDAAHGTTTGPESLRQQAWESLERRLPRRAAVVRPIAGAGPRTAPPPRFSRAVYGVAASLLLALTVLSVWVVATVRQERRRLAQLEQQLEERDAALTAAESALAEARRRLDTAAAGEASQSGARVQELETRVTELTATLEEVRRTAAASRSEIAVAVAPRFALRGQEPSGNEFLRGNGAVNPVRLSAPPDRFTVALDLADPSAYAEVRVELFDTGGHVLWSGRQPGKSFLGDAGTSVALTGIGPGRYRLRLEGIDPTGSTLLAEFVLEVEAQETSRPRE